MPEDNGWGQGAVNNNIRWGQAPSTNKVPTGNGFGKECYNTYGHPETNLTGESAGAGFNTKSFFTDDPIVPISTNDGMDFLSLSDKVSFSFWFKMDAVIQGSIPWITMVAGRAAVVRLQGAVDTIQNRTTISFIINSQGVMTHLFPQSDWTTGWNHIAVSYDNSSGSGLIKCFVNGSNTGATSFAQPSFGSSTFFPVANIGKGTGTQIPGSYTQIGIWDIALTTPQIQDIYNSGCPGDISSLNPSVYLKIDNAITSGPGTSVPDTGSAPGLWFIAGPKATHILTDSPCP